MGTIVSKSMKKKYELTGYRLEILGLILALSAAFWQAHFSGWWDTQRVEWQYWIQEEVNLSVLRALKNIAYIHTIEDPEKLKEYAYEASDKANLAVFKAVEMRMEREERLSEQADLFSKIGFFLMALSAICIIVGKYLVYLSAKLE